MKNAVLLALVAALATPVLAGVSAKPAKAQSAEVSVTVIIIKDREDDDDQTQQIPRRYRFPDAETIALAQEEIRSNAYIRGILQRKRVQLRNVVGVQTAWSGGKIVYVR